MPNKLLEIQPQQFDVLLSDLDEKTPPKEKTLYTIKEIVERLYDFITKSLDNHYSYDELAVMIRESLETLELEEEIPEIRGGTLKKYYLEVKREKESTPTRQASGKHNRKRSASKKTTAEIATGESKSQPREMPSEMQESDSRESAKPKSGTKKLPRPDSSGIKLAY